MSSLVDSLFGGTDDSAQKNQIRANERTQQFIEEQARLARGDVQRLMPQAADSARGGYRQGYDLMRSIAPHQINATRLGNIHAQQSLLSGMNQQKNAILGDPTSNAGMQVARLGERAYEPFNKLGQMQDRTQMGQPQQQAQQQPVDYQQIIQALLGGRGF